MDDKLPTLQVDYQTWVEDLGDLPGEPCVEIRIRDPWSEVSSNTMNKAEVRALRDWLTAWLDRLDGVRRVNFVPATDDDDEHIW